MGDFEQSSWYPAPCELFHEKERCSSFVEVGSLTTAPEEGFVGLTCGHHLSHDEPEDQGNKCEKKTTE